MIRIEIFVTLSGAMHVRNQIYVYAVFFNELTSASDNFSIFVACGPPRKPIRTGMGFPSVCVCMCVYVCVCCVCSDTYGDGVCACDFSMRMKVPCSVSACVRVCTCMCVNDWHTYVYVHVYVHVYVYGHVHQFMGTYLYVCPYFRVVQHIYILPVVTGSGNNHRHKHKARLSVAPVGACV